MTMPNVLPSSFTRTLVAACAFLAFSIGIAAANGTPAFKEILASRADIARLRDGGFVLYIRSGVTDNSRPDQVPVNLADCATQRPLNSKGRKMSRLVGDSIARLGLPIGAVHVSTMCRTQDTARAMFPAEAIIVEENLRYLANMTAEEKHPIIARTLALLAAQPAAGKNTVIVAHAANLTEIMGYFPVEATMVIFKPAGHGNFAYVASVPPSHWNDLLP